MLPYCGNDGPFFARTKETNDYVRRKINVEEKAGLSR